MVNHDAPRKSAASTGTAPTPGSDPFEWLENVESDEALAWVREHNKHADASLTQTERFTALESEIREVLDDDARIPHVTSAGGSLYNFWRDAEQPRGVWRRTTEAEYIKAEPQWETLLDLDELNRTEHEDWVWSGASVLRPDCSRALVHLSHGGSDADVTREFDLTTKTFIPADDGGFFREESKGALSWIDQDTVFAFSDFGPGTMTPSGYPRTVRRWQRGTPIAEATEIYAGTETDMYISAHHDRTPGFERDFISRSIAFYDSELFLLNPDDTLTRIETPNSAETLIHREWLAVLLREDWTLDDRTMHPAGSLIGIPFNEFIRGERSFDVLFAPTETVSLENATWTRNHLVLTLLDDVQNRIEVWTPPSASSDGWSHRSLDPGSQDRGSNMGTVALRAVDAEHGDDLWLIHTDFLTPTTLGRTSAGNDQAEHGVTVLKQMPAFFDGSDLEVAQHFVTSDDGTRVPYFLVHAKDVPVTGDTPTILYGYGGFEISLTPNYSGTLGRAWLARGGAYAIANIRGGGEYGPQWHQAALKQNRHRAYQDFAAVARNLIERRITSPKHLAVQGGSNGGLLTGNMLVHYPELFGAVIIQVPLLDMFRYPHLLAGASWMAEYGNPDAPEEWEFIRNFSPYHLVDPDADYPPVLLTTSTRDDRVHPGHARKMAALLGAHGKDVTYYENVEGGHGGAADNAQAAHMAALAYEFCWQQLST